MMNTKTAYFKTASIFIVFLAVCVLSSLLRDKGGTIDQRVVVGMVTAAHRVLTQYLIVVLFLGIFFKIWQPRKAFEVVAYYWFVPAIVVRSIGALFVWVLMHLSFETSVLNVVAALVAGFVFMFALLVPFFYLFTGLEEEFQLKQMGKKPFVLFVSIIVVQIAVDLMFGKFGF